MLSFDQDNAEATSEEPAEGQVAAGSEEKAQAAPFSDDGETGDGASSLQPPVRLPLMFSVYTLQIVQSCASQAKDII